MAKTSIEKLIAAIKKKHPGLDDAACAQTAKIIIEAVEERLSKPGNTKILILPDDQVAAVMEGGWLEIDEEKLDGSDILQQAIKKATRK